jgi:aryl-alcohol dehydrogenase-like predicted oxidoreductase
MTMRTVKLGSTNEQVSALCLGAMYYGTKVNQPTSYRLLDQYLDAGGTFIDTANIYAWWVTGFHGGESETLVGQWMKERNNRDRVFIASKAGFGYGEVKTGLSATQIQTECEKSLRRLGIETIDLYYAHVDDRQTPQEETLEAFSRLVKAGKVRSIGASNFRAWRLEQADWISRTHGTARYQCVQQRYTFLQPRTGMGFDPQVAANEDLMDYCRRRSVTLLAYSPLLAGAYTRPDHPLDPPYRGTDNTNRLAGLRAVAEAVGATLNQVILAWMLQSDPLALPVFSASTPEQMTEDLGALDVELSHEQMKQLTAAGVELLP